MHSVEGSCNRQKTEVQFIKLSLGLYIIYFVRETSRSLSRKDLSTLRTIPIPLSIHLLGGRYSLGDRLAV